MGFPAAAAAPAEVDAAPVVREAGLASADPGPEARTGVSLEVTGPEAANRRERLDSGGCVHPEPWGNRPVLSVAEGPRANGFAPFVYSLSNGRAAATLKLPD